jgi:regulator of vacuolar morphogenesis
MAAIQSVTITGTKDRTSPKPHTVYEISVKTSMRSWQMWRRYSEFVDLHDELVRDCKAPPPAPLPGKHIWSLKSSFHNQGLIQERKMGLEAYLRAIVASKDAQWRENNAFKRFLGIPLSKVQVHDPSAAAATSGVQFSTASWIEEHSDLQALARNIRASLNKRDSLWDAGEVRASGASNVYAKRQLLDLLDRLEALTKGLQALKEAGLSEGELQRRTDMVTRLQDECEQLGKIVAIARNPQRQRPPTSADASNGNRATLLNNATGSNFRPVTRVFGAPQPIVQETEETRPLDDRGLLQLQKHQMKEQDQALDNLSAILQRQMQIGLAISTEVEEQIGILKEMETDVDRVTDKIQKARKTMAQIS